MDWTNIATRVANTDSNAAADINALMADLLLIKGGTAGTTPSTTLEAIKSDNEWNVRAGESGTITAATISEQKLQRYAITGTSDRKLPTTGVLKGWEYVWANNSEYPLTIKSSDGDSIIILVGAQASFIALQDTPTAKTHWGVLSKTLSSEKTYLMDLSPGITQLNGVATIVSSDVGSAVSVMHAEVTISRTIDGTWRARGTIRLDLGNAQTAITLTITGMKAKYSAATAYGSSACLIYTSGSNSDIAITQSAYQYPNVSFDVALDEKPTWAD